MSPLHKNTNQTVDYMTLGFMIFMRGLDITWGIGRGLLKVSKDSTLTTGDKTEEEENAVDWPPHGAVHWTSGSGHYNLSIHCYLKSLIHLKIIKFYIHKPELFHTFRDCM